MLDLIPLEQPEKSLFWGASVAEDSELATEDPLALDYVAQQIGMLLLPPLTTRSTRAQGFAMVAYGLYLAERAIDAYDLSDTDEVRRELFERWERFWALATLELRGGRLPRGDWDAMRGVRGAQRAWFEGDKPLRLDFQMISRQQELGNLGAYLAPMRRAGLVLEGTVRPGPAALDIIDAFWDERGEGAHISRFENYALASLEPGKKTIDERLERTVRLRERWLEFLLGAPPDLKEHGLADQPSLALRPSFAEALRIEPGPKPDDVLPRSAT